MKVTFCSTLDIRLSSLVHDVWKLTCGICSWNVCCNWSPVCSVPYHHGAPSQAYSCLSLNVVLPSVLLLSQAPFPLVYTSIYDTNWHNQTSLIIWFFYFLLFVLTCCLTVFHVLILNMNVYNYLKIFSVKFIISKTDSIQFYLLKSFKNKTQPSVITLLFYNICPHEI